MRMPLKIAGFGVVAAAAFVTADRMPQDDAPTQQTPNPSDSVCSVQTAGIALRADLAETSGLALGTGKRLWTHNDGDGANLFALDVAGNIVQEVSVEDVELDDWEDVASSSCATGTCLYFADTGDNGGKRRDIAIHVVPEPAAGERTVRATATLRARYPDAPQDAEALFVLPDGQLFVVTKGRHAPVALYRVPQQHDGDAVVLERVRELAPRPDNPFDLVTAATATPDGKWIAIRTYRALLLYPAQQLIGNEPVEPVHVDLTSLGHEQGESIALDAAGTAWLTSEDETGKAPLFAQMSCRL